MNLFNEYNNKTIEYLSNYINKAIRVALDPLSKKDLSSVLTGGNKHLTTEQIVNSVINDAPSECLNILFEDETDSMLPLYFRSEPLPALYSKDEFEWLYLVLSDPKADLFLSKEKRNDLLSKLKMHLDKGFVNVYEKGGFNHLKETYSDTEIENFKKVVSSLNAQSFVFINKKDGRTFEFLPFKVIYDSQIDSFFVIGMDKEKLDLLVISFDDIEAVGEKTLDYSNSNEVFYGLSYTECYETLLKKHKVAVPAIIEVLDSNTAPTGEIYSSKANDRVSHLFSDFDTLVHKNENGNLIYEITYYDFQENQVLDALLTLGKYIKILGPDSLLETIKNLLN